MEVKSTIQFEVKKEDRVYRLDIPLNCPLGEAFTACGEFMDKMVELINKHQEQRKAMESQSEDVAQEPS